MLRESFGNNRKPWANALTPFPYPAGSESDGSDPQPPFHVPMGPKAPSPSVPSSSRAPFLPPAAAPAYPLPPPSAAPAISSPSLHPDGTRKASSLNPSYGYGMDLSHRDPSRPLAFPHGPGDSFLPPPVRANLQLWHLCFNCRGTAGPPGQEGYHSKSQCPAARRPYVPTGENQAGRGGRGGVRGGPSSGRGNQWSRPTHPPGQEFQGHAGQKHPRAY